MSYRPSVAHSGLIARTELRRRWRALRGKNPLQLLALAVVCLFGLLFVAAAAFLASAAGGRIAAGDAAGVLSLARPAAAGAWAFIALTVAARAFQNAEIDNADGMLTTVPHRDVMGGLLLAEFATYGGPMLAVLAAIAAAFAVGSGSAFGGLGVFVGASGVVLLGFLVGFDLGLATKTLLGRSAFVSDHKAALGAVAMLAYLGAIATDAFGRVVGEAVVALGRTPLAWFADLALAPVADVRLRAAAAAVLAAAVATPALIAVAVAVAERAWYADPPARDDGGAEPTRGVADRRALALADRLPSAVSRPTAVVAAKSWLRAWRAPIKLSYGLYPLFVFYVPASGALRGDGLGATAVVLPATVALYGAWLTGAAFTLNPLGDEGAVLPVTVTTGASGAQLIRGQVLAGALAGAPLTVVGTLAAGALVSFPPVATVLTAALGALLGVGAAATAAGVGVAFPKFETSNVGWSREAVVPSLWAFVVYSALLLLFWTPGSLAQVPVVADAAGDALSLPSAAVTVAGFAVSVALVGVVGWVAYGRAIAAFETFEF